MFFSDKSLIMMSDVEENYDACFSGYEKDEATGSESDLLCWICHIPSVFNLVLPVYNW